MFSTICEIVLFFLVGLAVLLPFALILMMYAFPENYVLMLDKIKNALD